MRKLIILTILLMLKDVYALYNEKLDIAYNSFNTTQDNPTVFRLNEHKANLIINVKNELIYRNGYANAKAVIRFGDSVRHKFVELDIYNNLNRLVVSLFTNELGYVKFYDDYNSWFRDKELVISLEQNSILSVHNGQRIIIDRLDIGSFTLDSIEVYSKDSTSELDNVVGGSMIINILSGNPLDNPIAFTPLVAVGVVGAIVIILLKLKKR